ncbi:hypothetical protein M413DRAFT_278602 [Hebeloma cylindrosporum]|uniref:Uncharacterized protein n=1 Tax=Hebeloma cylindrosporum TaxID=76867 RepID=A0A0C3BYQ1_HEBCY|nr:hypothetical protein M413DRAFT_278602 [Hebeloma cylindrosporum h7]
MYLRRPERIEIREERLLHCNGMTGRNIVDIQKAKLDIDRYAELAPMIGERKIFTRTLSTNVSTSRESSLSTSEPLLDERRMMGKRSQDNGTLFGPMRMVRRIASEGGTLNREVLSVALVR